MKVEVIGFVVGIAATAIIGFVYAWKKRGKALIEAKARGLSAESNDVEKKVFETSARSDQSLKEYKDAVKAHRSTPPGVPPSDDSGGS